MKTYLTQDDINAIVFSIAGPHTEATDAELAALPIVSQLFRRLYIDMDEHTCTNPDCKVSDLKSYIYDLNQFLTPLGDKASVTLERRIERENAPETDLGEQSPEDFIRTVREYTANNELQAIYLGNTETGQTVKVEYNQLGDITNMAEILDALDDNGLDVIEKVQDVLRQAFRG